jgi:SpoVK/Ycf46/Vps4 family AAA+-type ATPase
MCSYEISARGKTQAENAAPLSGEARFPFNKNEPTPYHLLLKVFDLEGNAYKYSHPVALSRYKYRNATLDHLVASNEVKKLISILTSGAASIRSDIVEDKGMGRILMLTGMPGTGKTLTAEIVADSSKKPLLRIKSATLGTTVDSVERNLTLIMRRAEAWDCIVLFDEADVFIQKRGDSLEKNALVGVFLQILEYCNTTVFMTTNREHDIDDAIVSRCDALINFGMPDESQRKTLWLRHAEIAGVKLPDGIVNSLSKEFRVTGRTIKKCVALAKRIADAENATPSEKTMTRVMRFVPGGPLSSHVNREFNAEELLGNLSKDQLEEVQEYLDRKGP